MADLSTYIAIDRRHALANGHELPDRAYGAVLLADISGFTSFTAALADELGPQRGAEELTIHLNRVFSALIAEVHRYHGSVTGFAGDAITCWFPAELQITDCRLQPDHVTRQATSYNLQSAIRAVACALAMQAALGRLAATTTPAGTPVVLAVKIAVCTGSVRRFVLGDPQIQQLDILAGHTLDRVNIAAQHAQPGEVLITADMATELAQLVTITDWRSTMAQGERLARVEALLAPASANGWPALASNALNQVQVRPWLHAPLYHALRSSGRVLAELRPVVTMFLAFTGIDYDHDPAARLHFDAFVRQVQHTIARYEGVLLHVTVGDKGSYLHAAFGALLAHEDDAARAVAAADELRRLSDALAPLAIGGIGVAAGLSYAGSYGSQQQLTYDVLGDKTNLAARLMERAPPGAIWCDDTVYQRTRNRRAFALLPPVRLKGKAGLVRAYQAGELTTNSATLTNYTPPTALVGRRAEVTRLAAALDAVVAGGQRVVFIEGEAGIGKSRLIGELARLLRERGLTGLLGAGQSIEQQTAYRAWRDIFSSFFELDQVADPAERYAQVAQLLGAIAAEQRERLPLLGDLLPLSVPDTPLTAGLDPALRQESLLALLSDLLCAWAHEQPLVLVLEDAHWLDPLAWQLASRVVRTLQAANVPLLLVVVQRPLDEPEANDQPAAALRAHEHSEIITLHALAANEAVALAAAQLGLPAASLPRQLASLIGRAAGGNPFFAEQLALALRDQRLISIETSRGTPHAHLNGDIETLLGTLPDTLHGLVLARIDRLTAEQQLVLKTAAVIGRSFGYAPLAYALRQHGAPADSLPGVLETLTRRNLTALEQPEPELSYIFSHSITQEVAYQTQLFAQRQQTHQFIVDWYEASYHDQRATLPQRSRLAPYYPLLVYHCHNAANHTSERHYAQLAGQQAVARYANDAALTYFSRALELTLPTEYATCYELLLARAQVYDLQGRRSLQCQDLTQLTSLAATLGNPQHQAEAARHWALYYEVTGDYPAAHAAAEQSAVLSQAAGDLAGEADSYRRLGGVCILENDPAARAHLERAIQLARQSQRPDIEAGSLINLGNVAWFATAYAEAQQLYQQALAIIETISNLKIKSIVLNNLGIVASLLGNNNAARAYYQQALALCRQIGDQRGEGRALRSTGSLADSWGDYASAHSDYQQALQICRTIGDRSGESEALAYLAMLAHHQGNDQAALHYSRQALLVAEATGARDEQARAQIALGTALEGTQPPAAATAYQHALELFYALDQANLATEAHAGLARLALANGQIAAALRQVEPILPWLNGDELDGTDEPFRIAFTCYQVLHTAADPRALPLLTATYQRLMQRAAHMQEPELRQSLLEQVVAHRAIVAAYQAIQTAPQPQNWLLPAQ